MPRTASRGHFHSAGKRTAEAVQHEVGRLLQVVLAEVRKSGQMDMEATEMLVRGSMHRAGTEILGRLLSI